MPSRTEVAPAPSSPSSLHGLVALGRSLAGAPAAAAPAPALADLAVGALPGDGGPRIAAGRHRDIPDDVAAGMAEAALAVVPGGHADAWRDGLRAAFGADGVLTLPLGADGGSGALALASLGGRDGIDRAAAQAAADALADALAAPAGDLSGRARGEFLVALRDRLDQVTDPERTFPVAAAELRALFGASLVNLNEIHPDGTVAVRVSGEGSFLSDGTYPLDQVYRPDIQALMATGEPIAAVDVRHDPLTAEFGAEFAARGVIAVLGVPVLREGRWVGTLVVGLPAPREWQADEVRLVRSVAERVWAARERAALVRDLEAAAERLRRSREEARRQLGELEAIYATAPVGLGTLDRDLRFVRINERLAELNGVPAADHLGRTVREIVPLVADDAEPLLRRVLETGEPAQDIEIVGETAAAPGVERAWLEHWSPIHDGDGETIGINIVAEDITERKRAEDDRIAFTQAVVHDIRNPLTVIQGAAQLLQMRARRGRLEPGEIDESMDAVTAAVARSLDVLDDLLDAAQLRAGRPVRLQRTPCDLAGIAGRVAASLRAGAPLHRIAVEAEPGAAAGSWDRRRMERAIANLLENAVKYSPDGGRVTVRLAREDGPEGPAAVLAVADEGIGIRPEDLPHLFEPFRRGGNVAGRIGGHGIGLAGVKQIVDLHGGTIAAESREGHGSTFTIRLPIRD